ncbi:hypothetical protein [Lacinutrix cladophorae]
MKNLITILCLCFTPVIFSQNTKIDIPVIDAPEVQFISIFQKEKIDNPIFLNGKVKEVHKKITTHIHPNRKETSVENYQYTLNKNMEVIRYASDVEFDEMNIDFLNSQKEFPIQKDTIITQNNIKYNFKKGKLISKTSSTLDEDTTIGVTDSIHFSYKNNKITEIIEFQKEALVEIDEDTNQENYLISNDYFMTSYKLADYENKLVNSKLAIEYIPDVMVLFVSKTDYIYNNNNLLTSFKKTNKEYEIVVEDISNYLKKIKNNKLPDTPFKTQENIGIFTYDSDNRVIKLEAIIDNQENQVYKMVYSNNKTIITRESNGVSDIEYQFNYDNNNNPIQEKRFIYLEGKKYLDTQTTIDITYF